MTKQRTSISVDKSTWQAIEDFEAQIKSEKTKALQDKWSAFKKQLGNYLELTYSEAPPASPGGSAALRGGTPPPPWPPRI